MARGPAGPPLMIGSEGPRMLSITLPHVQSWNAWFTWFGNSPEGYRPLRDKVDAACREAGRDPAEVERTLALFVSFPGAQGRQLGDFTRPDVEPIPGEPARLAQVAARLRRGGRGTRAARARPDHAGDGRGAGADARAARRLTAAILAAW